MSRLDTVIGSEEILTRCHLPSLAPQGRRQWCICNRTTTRWQSRVWSPACPIPIDGSEIPIACQRCLRQKTPDRNTLRYGSDIYLSCYCIICLSRPHAVALCTSNTLHTSISIVPSASWLPQGPHFPVITWAAPTLRFEPPEPPNYMFILGYVGTYGKA